MKLLRDVLTVAGACGLLAVAQAATTPVDLSTWAEKGPPGNGTWTVSAGGTTVTQTINGDPTFFVGPGSFVDTVLRGSIRVTNPGDDDYIGFVMGYSAPQGSGNDMNFVLLDWKQADQSSGGFLAREGFALSRVNGTVTNYLPGFWGHTNSAGFDVLATNFGGTLGWALNTTYDFEITYRADRVTVSISGGAFTTPTTVLDVAGSFPSGQFGFYNYSQAGVIYNGFTLDDAPPPVAPIPEASTNAMMLVGLGVLGWVLRRRRR